MSDTKAYHVLETAAAAIRLVAELGEAIYEALDDDGKVDGWEGLQIGGTGAARTTELIPLIKNASDAGLDLRDILDGLHQIHRKLVSPDAVQWFNL